MKRNMFGQNDAIRWLNSGGLIVLLLIASLNVNAQEEAQTHPFVSGEDGASKQLLTQRWSLVETLSDEFEGDELSQIWDTRNIVPGKFLWNGRYPGLFQKKNVSVVDGELWMEGKREDVVFEGRTWTHTGAILRSHASILPGMYTEAKMKTTSTIMSGTFWMQTPHAPNCETVPKTELDVTESIGRASSNTKPPLEGESVPEWYEKARTSFLQGINATARQRQDGCTEKAINIETSKDLSGTFSPSEDFHVYGFHWRTPTQLDFFVDGKFNHTIVPSIPFEKPMALILAIEIYDFNWPTDAKKDGFMASKKDRSTRYQWIRTWKTE